MKFNQLVARGLVIALLASNIPVALAETTVPAIPENPTIESSNVPEYASIVEAESAESVYEKLYNRFQQLLVAPYEAKLGSVFVALEDQQAQIKSDLGSSIDDLTYKADYPYTSEDMTEIFNLLVAQKSLILEMRDAETPSYEVYGDDLKLFVTDLYYALPDSMRTDLNLFGDKEATVEALVDLMLADTFITRTETSKGNFADLVVDSDLEAKFANTLKGLKSGQDDKANKIAKTLYELVKFNVKALEDNLKAYSTDVHEDGIDLAVVTDMLKIVDYVAPVDPSDDDDDDDDDDNGGGSSGGTGGAPSGNTGNTDDDDDSDLSDDDQEKVDDIKDNLPQAGEEATDAQKEAAKDAADDLISNLDSDLEDAKDADKQVEAVAEVIGDTIAALDAEEAVEVAEEFVEMVENVLDNPNVSVEEQTEMVTNVIENTFSKLVDNEETVEADLVDVKEEMAALVETVVKNAATVEVLESTTPQAGEGANEQVKSFEIGAADLEKTIANAIKVQEELAKTLKDNGMADVAKAVEKVVNIALPEVKATEEVALTLAAEAVKSLGEQGVGVTVEAKGLNFMLPAELMKASKDLSITSKPVTRADNLTTDTDAGKVMNHKTLNVSVEDGEETVKGMVELSFSLDDVNVDLDQLMVGVFEDGKWTKLDYTVVNNQVVFTAPHFSIYSLMTFTPSFTDIEASWAKKYITSLTAKGIVSGKSAEVFDPNATLTRAEFTTMIVKHLGLDEEMKQNFKDVAEDAWYYNYVGNAGLNGLTAGVENGEFRPNDPITREDMAVMLYRAYKLKRGFALETGAAPFSDHAKISSDALDAVYAVRTNGIISGYPDNTFRPEANATRAEAATMLYLFLEK